MRKRAPPPREARVGHAADFGKLARRHSAAGRVELSTNTGGEIPRRFHTISEFPG